MRNARGNHNSVLDSVGAWTLTAFVSILFVACATRPLPGRDWESAIDLRFTYDSFNNVNLDIVCQNRSENGTLAPAKVPICKSVSLDLASHGATTAEERARNLKDAIDLDGEKPSVSSTQTLIPITLEITIGPTASEGCGLLALPLIASLGVIPCSSIRSTPIDVRVIDQQGVALESHRMLQMERRAYGSTALVTLIGGKARRERRESVRRMIHFIENRVYAATLRNSRSTQKSAGNP